MTIAGPIEIDNTKLAGFDLGSKIQGINPLGGTSGGTQIEKVSVTVNSSPQATSFSNIYRIGSGDRDGVRKWHNFAFRGAEFPTGCQVQQFVDGGIGCEYGREYSR